MSDPVPDVGDAFDTVDGADQCKSEGSALDLAGDGDDANVTSNAPGSSANIPAMIFCITSLRICLSGR